MVTDCDGRDLITDFETGWTYLREDEQQTNQKNHTSMHKKHKLTSLPIERQDVDSEFD